MVTKYYRNGIKSMNNKEVSELGANIITFLDRERYPLLEAISQPCQLPLSQQDEDVIAKMDSVLTKLGNSAIGLAAVQVGYPKRIFMLRISEQENKVFINPELISASKKLKHRREGCLSLPGFGARLKRPSEVTIKYIGIDEKEYTESFRGILAQACWHEIMHLSGRLISHELSDEILKQPKQTSFGMKLTPHRKKALAARRAANKRAKKCQRKNR